MAAVTVALVGGLVLLAAPRASSSFGEAWVAPASPATGTTAPVTAPVTRTGLHPDRPSRLRWQRRTHAYGLWEEDKFKRRKGDTMIQTVRVAH